MTGGDEVVRAEPVGVIVCGGSSQRMGTDKALMDWDGRPLISIAARALRSGGCARVVAVTRADHLPADAVAGLGIDEVLLDEWPGEGPMGALVTALRAIPTADLVVLPCDLPLVTGDVVAALIEAPGDVVVAHDGALQPFVARFAAKCGPELEEQWNLGQRSLRRALSVIGHLPLVVEPGLVVDVDTPAAVRKVEDLRRSDP